MKTGGDNCTLTSNEIDFETEELLVGSKVRLVVNENVIIQFVTACITLLQSTKFCFQYFAVLQSLINMLWLQTKLRA